MNTVFIGDIHGNLETIQKVRDNYQDWHKIFVGDILDSFFNSSEKQLQCVSLLQKMIRDGNTTVIMGNHDVSYLIPYEQCSGHNPITQMHFDYDDTFRSIREIYRWYLHAQMGNKTILVTHAGLSNALLKYHDVPLNELTKTLDMWITQFRHGEPSPWGWAGRKRQGVDPIGGPLWCHYPDEFTEIPGITQVFGHTPDTEFRLCEQSWCIDMREDIPERQVLELVDDIFIVRPLH